MAHFFLPSLVCLITVASYTPHAFSIGVTEAMWRVCAVLPCSKGYSGTSCEIR